MSEISLKDNSEKSLSLANYTDDLKNIELIANKTIKDLSAENPALLVFPPCEKTEDQIEEHFIFRSTRSNAEITLKTENIMGFIARGNTAINIRSRFDEAKKDFFLHYLLQKVCHINLLELQTHFARERVFDFLPFLFPFYLNRALSQGLYKEYRRFEHNDANIRGAIDFNRHIRQNIPFNGKIAYKTREHAHDNAITQVVRHTIEYLRGNANYKLILNRDEQTQDAVKKIVEVTTYNRFERAKVLAGTTKSVRSPFFQKYEELRKLCRMILLGEKMRYENDNRKIYGILFDGAWLWEEYLWTLLEPCGNGIVHPRNKKGEEKISPFVKGSLGEFYPDFYKENSFVLDAKYKSFDDYNPKSCDLQQLIAYMHVLACARGEFLFPSKTGNSGALLLGKLNGLGGEIFKRALAIPQAAKNFQNFCEQIQKSEKSFIADLTKILRERA